jgi:VCBS repeat protein/putative Ig domain-containing protein/FG-GAP repeat protein
MQLRARATTLIWILALTVAPRVAAGSDGHEVQAWLSAASVSRAVAVSGPIIGVAPLTLSFGVVNIGDQAIREYTIQNVGDEDLEIATIVISDPQISTNAPLPLVVHPGGSFPANATYAPSGGPLAATLEFRSNSSFGAFTINASGRGNSAPVLDPIGPLSASAFIELRFAVTASDPDSDPVSFLAQGLPAGATFDEETGEFAWTPVLTDEGVHTVSFVATDGFASDNETVAITVAVTSHPPVLAQPAEMSVIALGTADQTLNAMDADGNPLSFFKIAGPSCVTVTTTTPGSGSGVGRVHLEPGILDPIAAALTVGVSDGALSDQKSFTATIVPGNAGGSFEAPKDYGSARLSSSFAVGDLNGDGRLDMAAVNIGSNSVSVLSGNGDGTFGETRDYPAGIMPISAAVGDLNGDGWLDLAVANSGSNSVSILVGGGGGFGDKTDYATGAGPRSVAVADLNGDGRLDLAVTNVASTVSVLLGNGDGTFGTKMEYGTEIGPGPLAVGDLSGDGRLDLVVANPNSSTVSVLMGDGSGGFGAKTDYGTGSHPVSVAIGDLNGDGRLDLAVANVSSGTVSVFMGQGNGSLGGRMDYPTGCEATSVAMGDLNGDGRLDVAVKNGCSVTVSIFLGNGDGSFHAKTDYAAGGSSVALRDLDGDRRVDLLVANNGTSTVSVLLNQAPERPVSLDVVPGVINLKSHGQWITAFIEPTGFDVSEINPSSVRLEGVAPVEQKVAAVTDHDRDGLPDLKLKFSLGALAPLLSVGDQTLRVTGSLLTGERFAGADHVRVMDPAGTHAGAVVTPNPLNPAGVLTFSTTKPGPVTIKVFDLRGRLVQVLVEARAVAAGSHEVWIDGRGRAGQSLSSGVYFYRVDSLDGTMTGRFAILK